MMADNDMAGSSQESLPLSQDTYESLITMMAFHGQEEMLSDLVPNNLDVSQFVPPVEPQPVVHGTRSSLPATSNWPGNYNFSLIFGQQEKINKHMTWTYSPKENKLYVKKDEPCPFSFQTNTVMPDNFIIRAMAVYGSPEFAPRPVLRCFNHSQMEQGSLQALHIIRSESHSATYAVEAETNRHSVFVPFENPPVGQDYSTYIFKFVCFSSCPGGPNRKPMTLVFTLEHGPNVLGRITLDLKICACPGRDRGNAEEMKLPKATGCPPAKKAKTSDGPSSSMPHNLFESFTKKRKASGTAERREYIIKVKNKECYIFLNRMKKLYQTYMTVDGLPPEYKAFLQFLRSSSDEDDSQISQ